MFVTIVLSLRYVTLFTRHQLCPMFILFLNTGLFAIFKSFDST
ncbi:hypothetical protein HanXRQr2_Chr02g0051161 [Helianthus annuus]|uniref:Uncharacterized protein n=1 Tax=Helianthus annuus TaxID=4232 RepID=A0A9K3JLH1_HELAN|nr:hypothetical protein HanXRQr2_Chr02g0051161 [Helianthus annuus]KAJ0950643.1 hypothetical protein HanPSC8_Chr02g0050601 [Helianthus annuus]